MDFARRRREGRAVDDMILAHLLEEEELILGRIEEEEEEEEFAGGRGGPIRRKPRFSNPEFIRGWKPYQKRRVVGNQKTGLRYVGEVFDEPIIAENALREFGMSMRSLERLINDARLAVKVDPVSGEETKWFVDDQEDARFRPEPIPLANKIKACIMYIRSGHSFHTLQNSVNISQAVLSRFFTSFCEWMVQAKYAEHVFYPRNAEEREAVSSNFGDMGFPGCVGLADCVHVVSKAIPKEFYWKSKQGRGQTTYTVNVTVDSNNVILCTSPFFFGTVNDIHVAEHDDYITAIKSEQLFTEHEFELSDIMGNRVIDKGSYLLTDCGYHLAPHFICPNKSVHETISPMGLVAKLIESVRKFVECTFGQMKEANKMFDGGIQISSAQKVQNAFKTACILHNMRIRDNNFDLRGTELDHWRECESRMPEYVVNAFDQRTVTGMRVGLEDEEPYHVVYEQGDTAEVRINNFKTRMVHLAQHTSYLDRQEENGLLWMLTRAELGWEVEV